MNMIRQLSDQEILEIAGEVIMLCGCIEPIMLARLLFERAAVKQTERGNPQFN